MEDLDTDVEDEIDEDLDDEEPGEQSQSRPGRADHLAPWQFKPGQSGNPSGRAKGTKSLKEYAKDMLAAMDDDERQEFLKGINKKDIWEMAEGKPDTKTELGGKDGGPVVFVIDPAAADRFKTNGNSAT